MSINFSIQDMVTKRYSVRTFEKRDIEQEKLDQIMEYAKQIQNPFGPDMRVELIEKETAANGEKLGTYGVIKGAKTFLGVAISGERCAQEAMGYAFEQLVLYITSLGLGTCWLGGTFDRGAFGQAMKLQPHELFPIISPIGYPIEQKRFAEKMFRKAIKADTRMKAEDLFFEGEFEHPLTQDGMGVYAYPLEMVRLAPSAVNKQPWRVVKKDNAFHFYEKHTMAEAGVIDMQRIDMGIALCHFHLAAQEKGLLGRFAQMEDLAIDLPKDTEYIVSWICGE